MATEAHDVRVAELVADLYHDIEYFQCHGGAPLRAVARAAVRIKRTITLLGRSIDPDHNENDAEHSFVLALSAYEIAQEFNLKVSTSKLLLMALVHDLPEIFFRSGRDISIRQKHLLVYKPALEAEALARLEVMLGCFPEIITLITEYANKSCLEARVIAATEAVVAWEEIDISGGHIWKQLNDDFASIAESQLRKAFLISETGEMMARLVAESGVKWQKMTGITIENPRQVVADLIAKIQTAQTNSQITSIRRKSLLEVEHHGGVALPAATTANIQLTLDQQGLRSV